MGQRRPLGMRRGAWFDEAEESPAESRVEFRRLVELKPREEVRSGRGPAVAAAVGLLLLAGVVLLAYVLYRVAPP